MRKILEVTKWHGEVRPFCVKSFLTVWMIEVNPRASRTVPFVSKAIGVPLADIAARCMVGEKLADIGFTQEVIPAYSSVKEAVFPFVKFPGGGAGSCGRGFHRRHRGSYTPEISLLICDEVINVFRFGLSVIRIVWKYNVKSSSLILH